MTYKFTSNTTLFFVDDSVCSQEQEITCRKCFCLINSSVHVQYELSLVANFHLLHSKKPILGLQT